MCSVCIISGFWEEILGLDKSPGVGEAEWAFKTIFDVTEDILAAPNVDLVFDGLDTFAVVKLVRYLLPPCNRYVHRDLFMLWVYRMVNRSSSTSYH